MNSLKNKVATGYEQGSTIYLLYWQWEWAKRFFRTWYHIVNRQAYWEFRAKQRDSDLDFILNKKNRFYEVDGLEDFIGCK